MKCYILRGNQSDVDKLIQENRIRIARGVISITPCELDDDKAAGISDTKAVPETDDKTPKKRVKK